MLGISHYNWNVSGLLHMDVPFGQEHQVPSGLVLYSDAAYDGMLYYQVARDLPALFTGGTTSLDSPYRFQRVLLPLLTYAVTLGHEPLFPFALLGVNIAAVLGTLFLMLRITRKVSVHTLAIVFNPAALIGVLYTLTEPLSIFFLTLFFAVWLKRGQKLDVLSLAALTLSLLARETTVFLIGLLFVWFLWKRQWKQAVLVIIPMVLFTLWQWFLVHRLGAVPFQANGNVIDLPFVGPLSLLQWLASGLNPVRLSALGLLLFVLPLCAALLREWLQLRTRIDLLCFLVSGLAFTMLCMDKHMWGAITSIGRVVTPFYPVYVLYAAARDTWVERRLSALLIAVSIVAAIGIAAVAHPFVIS
jgi:hypothetical protein